jgi:hypothetical protein
MKILRFLRLLLTSCWFIHVTDVLVPFKPLRHPCDPDCYREEGGSTFLRNIRTHIHHTAYESKIRPPTDRSTWQSALFVIVNVILR